MAAVAVAINQCPYTLYTLVIPPSDTIWSSEVINMPSQTPAQNYCQESMKYYKFTASSGRLDLFAK